MTHPNTGTVRPTNAPGGLTILGFKVRRLALVNVGRRKGSSGLRRRRAISEATDVPFVAPPNLPLVGRTGWPGISMQRPQCQMYQTAHLQHQERTREIILLQKGWEFLYKNTYP